MVYQSRLDVTFAGLADPTRRAILARLTTGGKTISELALRFDMSLPAVSKHIRVLERAGLAQVRREGRVRRTTLLAAPLRDALGWIERYRQFWESQFDQLAAYLEGSVARPPHAQPAGPPQTKERTQWQPRPRFKAKRSKSGAPSTRRGSASSTPGRAPKS